MIIATYKEENKTLVTHDINDIKGIEVKDILWIDLNQPSTDEQQWTEEFLDIKLQTRQEVEEIESSSRYSESEDTIYANSNYLIIQDDNYTTIPVSFILKNGFLISHRNTDLKVFEDLHRKHQYFTNVKINSFQIFLNIFEIRIDSDADLIEKISKEISLLTKKISIEKDLTEELILTISNYQEVTMIVRESIIDKQRVTSALLKSDYFINDYRERIRIMIKDIGSLLDHTAFNFERLEYLQNTFLGLVNIEQNKIIKIFTVVTVIFMPPTLIASMYGMNFHFMPELQWKYGYPAAIAFMVLSSLWTLLFFKRKKWL